MKYPFDIATFKTKKDGKYETMSVEAHFIQELEESPMKVFDDKFSRFTLNLISSEGLEGAKQVVKINIPLEDIPDAREISKLAFQEYRFPVLTSNDKEQENNSPAFTTKFLAGTYKGKTPVDVLVENENGRDILNKQYTWLRDNLTKFPGNAVIMEAIRDAASLDIENLKSSHKSTSRVVKILDIGCRPLIRKTREDGKCFVYEGKITWNTDSEQRYPITICVKNYYADVVKRTDGTLNVTVSSKDSEISKTFRLTCKDWMFCLDRMELAEKAFYFSHFNAGFELAESSAKTARELTNQK